MDVVLTEEIIISTRNAKGAAVLMSGGAVLDGAYPTRRKGTVQFDLRLPSAEAAAARDRLAKVGGGMDVEVHLGDYERAYRVVRDAIRQVHDRGDDHDGRRVRDDDSEQRRPGDLPPEDQ